MTKADALKHGKPISSRLFLVECISVLLGTKPFSEPTLHKSFVNKSLDPPLRKEEEKCEVPMCSSRTIYVAIASVRKMCLHCVDKTSRGSYSLDCVEKNVSALKLKQRSQAHRVQDG
jgi:hypothetical protein